MRPGRPVQETEYPFPPVTEVERPQVQTTAPQSTQAAKNDMTQFEWRPMTHYGNGEDTTSEMQKKS